MSKYFTKPLVIALTSITISTAHAETFAPSSSSASEPLPAVRLRAIDGLRLVVAAEQAQPPPPFKIECDGPPCQNGPYVKKELSHLEARNIFDITEVIGSKNGDAGNHEDEIKVRQSDGYWMMRMFWRNTGDNKLELERIQIRFNWTVLP